ncbi:DUF6653 family protein [Roseobacter sp.]|uniref:DUF6653 family protein n=1 Tax=Roseobacter sp. TaxID=1907202 RepID=UPI003299B126
MFDIFKSAERIMTMDDAAWGRHANPWSVWTRMLTCLPLLVLAIWSRVWIAGWAVVPVGLALLWIWLNPRVFPAPARLDSWASRGVMGERIFLTHRAQIADHHRRVALVLSSLSVPGAIVMVWGLWSVWWEGAVFGMILTAVPKIWFVDRMVWIYDDWVRAGGAVPGQENTDV